VLRGHAPLLSLLTEASVEIASPDGIVHAAVDGGFISVADDRVSILTEHALLAEEIKIDEARAELEAAEGLPTGDEREMRIRRASARIRAAEKSR
jgi:F-type H+-transporting ATPase subunit epsilon